MQDLVPTTPPVPDFTPVPRKYRYDGWTPERQKAFIHALAETGSVTAAARRVNMSCEGAYYLRRQPGAEEFRAAWESALDHGVTRLEDAAMERALNGIAWPVFGATGKIGERRLYNDRLLMFILRHRLPDRYGPLKALPSGTKHPDTLSREEKEAAQISEAEHRAELWTAINKAMQMLAQLFGRVREIWIASGHAAGRGDAEEAEARAALGDRLVYHLLNDPNSIMLFDILLAIQTENVRFWIDDCPSPRKVFDGFARQAMYRWDEVMGERDGDGED